MKTLTTCLFLILSLPLFPASAAVYVQQEKPSILSVEKSAEAVFNYFLSEVELDESLSHDEQQDKVEEFRSFAETLSPEVSSHLTTLLIDETRSRILDILQTAPLNSEEINEFLAGYEEAVLNVQDLDVEIAREMLFFVAELKIHRKYVYDFGVLLGAPGKQLLRHDLCKLEPEQFEGYARYFRGGRREEDKPRYLAAWEHHQYEEHHHQSYSKEGFSFDNFTEERLQNNMTETVADLLAATKQRGGGTLIYYLTKVFPTQNPHPRLLPFLENALKKAQAFYLESSTNPDLELFQDLPSWNEEIESIFNNLKGKI